MTTSIIDIGSTEPRYEPSSASISGLLRGLTGRRPDYAHTSPPPTQKPRLGRERGFWFWPPALDAGSVAGRPVGWRLGRDRLPAGAGISGERSAPAGMGKRAGEILREGLGRPAVIWGEPRSGAGLGPSSGGVPPFDGSRDDLKAARDDVVSG